MVVPGSCDGCGGRDDGCDGAGVDGSGGVRSGGGVQQEQDKSRKQED